MEIEINGIRVTDDPAIMEQFYGVSVQLGARMETLVGKALSGKRKALRDLEKLAAEYSDNVHIRFNLARVYLETRSDQTFVVAATDLMNDYPGYMFNKALMVEVMAPDMENEELVRMLGGSLNLNEVLPGRDRYHVSEFLAFYRAVFYIHLYARRKEDAARVLEMLRTVMPDSSELSMLEEDLDDPLNDEDFSYMLNIPGYQELAKVTEHVENNPMHHEEVNMLHTMPLDISMDHLNACLSLPRETLVEDLQLLIDRALDNHAYFSSEYNLSGMRDFAWHALMLLTHLRADEAFPALRRVLLSDPEVIDFWFMPQWTSVGIDIIYSLGRNNLNDLLDIYTDSRLELAEQVTLITAAGLIWKEEPGRKDEVADWMGMVIEFNKMRLQKGEKLSPPVLTVLARETAALRMKELSGLMGLLISEFNKKNPEISIPGDELGRVLKVPVKYRLKNLEELYTDLKSQ
ncbi:MAG: hypothetical protein EA364_13060 [Balneolaceae bacterium]|nr:MAG: hypothetical protein EA364_13060 [Balneolaceae bacterium]